MYSVWRSGSVCWPAPRDVAAWSRRKLPHTFRTDVDFNYSADASMRQTTADGTARWVVVVDEPTTRPVRAEALSRPSAQPERWVDTNTLWWSGARACSSLMTTTNDVNVACANGADVYRWRSLHMWNNTEIKPETRFCFVATKTDFYVGSSRMRSNHTPKKFSLFILSCGLFYYDLQHFVYSVRCHIK